MRLMIAQLFVVLISASSALADPTDDYVACVIGKAAVALQEQPNGKKSSAAAQETAYANCKEPKMDDQEGEGVSDYINIAVEAIAEQVWGATE